MPRSVPPPAWVITRRRAIGDRIRAARREAGLTQEQVALRVPMDRATYNRIEMGHAAALLDSLILIADVIGVPLSDLMREERPPPRERQGPPSDPPGP
ncbi:helix-turn-helix transcriptional regulator [Streptomyces sp. CS014]|uniref:helix-turn-helix domain-containing protein n=1 Tax=Streptomyces sp. CS014 TaxID=2162707 RepID=UPI000D512016|nr:helix-turn-helix transcriptional regulator [Streptomyces sp. CS014]PVD01361.1 XRE family transcriptional regulator [Streptomyces sp. CS014]